MVVSTSYTTDCEVPSKSLGLKGKGGGDFAVNIGMEGNKTSFSKGVAGNKLGTKMAELTRLPSGKMSELTGLPSGKMSELIRLPSGKYKESNIWNSGNLNLNLTVSWHQKLAKNILMKIGPSLMVYLALYFIINGVYRFLFNKEQKEGFEDTVSYLKTEIEPLSRDLTFLLGFYTTLVVKRWWDQFMSLPNPDNIALLCSALIDVQQDPKASALCNDLLRLVVLAFTLCMRKISKNIQLEFAADEDLLTAGLITKPELEFLSEKSNGNINSLYLVPLNWAMNRVKKGKFDNLFISDRKEIMRELINHRNGLYTVDVYQWEKIPPVYRQVVFLAVYVFFAFSLLSNQVLENGQDIYFPIILLLKFIFYFGWFKVAEALRNPFGVDGDDFEIAAYLARNIWSCNVHLQSGMFGHPQQETKSSEKEEEAEKSAKKSEKDGEFYMEYIDRCNESTRCP